MDRARVSFLSFFPYCYLPHLFLDVVIDARRPNAGLAGPRIDLRTGLARSHVSHARLVPQIAHFGVVALLGTVLYREEPREH